MEPAEKKKRAPNFSTNEKTLLLNIIAIHKHLIENKKTDSQTWKDKDRAWDKVTKLFNSQNPQNIFRTKDSLRKFYDNIKKNLRKVVADEKTEMTKTGGGGKKVFNKDPDMELCLSIINKKTIFGLKNQYDGDAIGNCTDESLTDDRLRNESHERNNNSSELFLEEPSTSRACDDIVIDYNEDHDYLAEVENTPPRTDWSNVAASQLKEKVSENLKHSWTKRRRPVLKQPSNEITAEYLALVKMKLEYYQKEKENMERLNERKEEIFKLKKRKLELEIEIRELEIAAKRNI